MIPQGSAEWARAGRQASAAPIGPPPSVPSCSAFSRARREHRALLSYVATDPRPLYEDTGPALRRMDGGPGDLTPQPRRWVSSRCARAGAVRSEPQIFGDLHSINVHHRFSKKGEGFAKNTPKNLELAVGKLLLTALPVTSQQFTTLKMRLLLCDVREHQGYYLLLVVARKNEWLRMLES